MLDVQEGAMSIGHASCADQELMLRVMAVAGTFNPYVETANDVLMWDRNAGRRGRVPSHRRTREG